MGIRSVGIRSVGRVSSAVASVLPPLLRLLRRSDVFRDPEAMRRRVADLRLRPVAYAPPRRLRRDVHLSVDDRSGWPVYLVTPVAPAGQVVYLHGGAWTGEISPWHWRFVARLAAEAQVSVTVPIYPLAPTGTAGTVVPRAADLVQALVDRYGADRVSLAGDSAGGQIALSAALVLRDRGVAPLRRVALVAPALDLRLTNPEIDRVEPTDPWLARPGVHVVADLWRGDLPLTDPVVSPVLGDLTGLGPLTVVCGTRDICAPDARLLVDRGRAAGLEVDALFAEGLVHVYPLLPVPEAAEARRLLVRGIAVTGAAAAQTGTRPSTQEQA